MIVCSWGSYNLPLQWNSAFLRWSFITEGTTEKVLQFKMPLKSIYIKTFVLLSKNVFLNTAERLKDWTIFKITSFYCSVYLFRAALCKLVFVLHKEVKTMNNLCFCLIKWFSLPFQSWPLWVFLYYVKMRSSLSYNQMPFCNFPFGQNS